MSSILAQPPPPPSQANLRLPPWLNKRRTLGPQTNATSASLKSRGLHSVCFEAKCPNLAECFANKTVTFLLMGNTCTRGCRFCHIKTRKNGIPLDPEEPQKVAQAAKELGLRHIVLTSVARDDLEDEGVSHFSQCIQACREVAPKVRVEILTPDFHAKKILIQRLCQTPPDIFNHNIETVERLQSSVRHRANYKTSLKTLSLVKQFSPNSLIKSGIMVGLGETNQELLNCFQDLRKIGVDILTIGQYMRPSKRHLSVKRYVTPQAFNELRDQSLAMGFKMVFSGPYVRSSYMADKVSLGLI